MMDIARTFIALRPNPVFTGDTVNFYSLETIAQTFEGVMPTQAEMDAKWVELQAQDNDPDYQATLKADFQAQFDDVLKAFALVVFDEINALRTNAGLPERTIAQLKNAIKAKL